MIIVCYVGVDTKRFISVSLAPSAQLRIFGIDTEAVAGAVQPVQERGLEPERGCFYSCA